ncbi:MAG: glycerophosphodiester phosphodiesterase family protein [Bacteroidia bacterium]|nr:glycerophosphodiester phosphodiesterase family protein [Bacteroidia bacterium]
MKNLFFFILLTSLFLACTTCPPQDEGKSPRVAASMEQLVNDLEDSQNPEIMVVSHRGDWRNAPENSLQAIKNCINMGVDMVEIDVRESKDGVLVLMHDQTIDRTTTGKGNISDWTYDSLQNLRLVDGLGVPTDHRIPTLEEALKVSKDKILINLDKSYDIFDKCFAIAEQTGTLGQIVIKGAKPRSVVEKEFGQYLDKVYFMPIIRLPDPKADSIIKDYLDHRLPIAFEFTVPSDTIGTIGMFDDIREAGAGVWVNSLWSHHCAGNDDRKAALDPNTYDWFIERNIDMIQTDRPALLLSFLQSKNLHR